MLTFILGHVRLAPALGAVCIVAVALVGLVAETFVTFQLTRYWLPGSNPVNEQ